MHSTIVRHFLVFLWEVRLSFCRAMPDLCLKVVAGIIAFMIGVVFIGGIALKIYAVQQLFQAKLDFVENAIDAKQALITPNLERLIEAKLGIKVRLSKC